MLDLAIVNGTLVDGTGQRSIDLGILDGSVALQSAPGALPEARRVIDAAGLFVLPGAIDSHFHCRAPSHPEREDFSSATRAAANGGVTTIIEMPISIPPTTDGPSLAIRRRHAERDAYVDVAFYGASGTLDRDRIQSAYAEGAVAFKAFLQEVPAGREEEFLGLCISRTDEMLQALELVGETGVPAVFHAEDNFLYNIIERRLKEAGRNDPQAHADSRPTYVEAVSIATLIMIAEATGAHLHIPHVSSGAAVELIRNGKAKGIHVTAETCPQYLVMTREALTIHGGYAKCNPPLKTQDDVDALWEGLRDGTIDTIATDHSPFTVADKEPGWTDIWKAFPGFPSVDILVPFVIGSALDGKISLERAIDSLTARPAAIFGLSPAKGSLDPGADADVVLYDPSSKLTVDSSTWKTKATEAGRVWNGMVLSGTVVETIVRGKTILDRGEIVGNAGDGRVLRGRLQAVAV
jgi:allantoinase